MTRDVWSFRRRRTWFSFCDDGYSLICFDPELPRVGVFGEVDVETGVVSTGKTVLDDILPVDRRAKARINSNDAAEGDVPTSSTRDTFFWFVSISCNSFRVRATAQLASAVGCDGGGYDVSYHLIK